MNSEENRRILGDHKKVKKKLVPPLLAFMGERFAPYSWARELVPEIAWIALLHRGLGLKDGVDFSVSLALAADRLSKKPIKPFFCKITSFNSLEGEEKEHLAEELRQHPRFVDAQRALSPLFHLLPESPLSFLHDKNEPTSADADAPFVAVLPELFDRNSRVAVLAMATAAVVGLRQGKISIATDKAPQITKALSNNFHAIERYPETEESRAAASSIRAMVPMLLLAGEEGAREKNDDWLSYFWSKLAGRGDCVVDPDPDIEEDEPAEGIDRILARFRNAARRELRDRLRRWSFDLNSIEKHEVVGALLARQTTLAVDLASCPMIWTPHSAPLFLRAMADVFISIAWILKDPQIRAQRFIDDGLGRVKLEIEHRKQQLTKGEDFEPDAKEILEFLEAWLASQRLEDFVEVNLGSWSGLNTRQMAEEAGYLDFYNYVYQPFSAAAHSTWPHISVRNAIYCANPAHRYHRVPVSLDLSISLHWLVLGAKYLEKAFKEFDKATGVVTDLPSAFLELQAELEKDAEGNVAPTEATKP